MGLIGQSEKRYMFLREAAMKMEAGFGDLALLFEGSDLDPTAREWLENLLGFGNLGKQDLESRMKYELALQGELKRFMMGRPPSMFVRRPQQPYGQPPHLVGYRSPPPGGEAQTQQQPPPGYGQQQQVPQQPQQPQQAPQQPQQPQSLYPEIPPGQLDLRDPKQAAAAVLRAQPMPLGPLSSQPSQPGQQPQQAYVPPGAYGVPPAQGAYGVPPGTYPQPPSQVPVVQAAPETATQVMAQSQPAVNVPAQPQNGVAKSATS
jgi:hypothetical protein